MHTIFPDIYWTGCIDWDLRNFHGYDTPSGSTYNAYLIIDKKPVLIDTVKHYGVQEMVARIQEVIDPSKIQYIISNHTEMDHSGSIDELLKFCPEAQVVCSPKGLEGLRRHFKKDWRFKVVETNDELCIGRRTLKFFLMPMVHWPDSMATYLADEKILFSNDAFGQHRASHERFADELGIDIAFDDAAKYYANIVTPYGNQVIKALDALKALPIEMIAPSHGLMWRRKQDIERIVALYQKWACYEPDKKVLIIYDTMWHSTKMMAERFYELIDQAGIVVKMVSLQQVHISDIVTDIQSSRIVFFGTPILNNRMLPTMAGLLMYLKGLKTKNRYALTFGSYGWSTLGFKELEQSVQDAGFELLSKGQYICFIPDKPQLDQLKECIPIITNKMKGI